MELLLKLKKLFSNSKRYKAEEQRAASKCMACEELTQYFVIFGTGHLNCLKCYEEDKWLAKVKRKEAITNAGF